MKMEGNKSSVFFFLFYYHTTKHRNSHQFSEYNKDCIYGGILAWENITFRNPELLYINKSFFAFFKNNIINEGF